MSFGFVPFSGNSFSAVSSKIKRATANAAAQLSGSATPLVKRLGHATLADISVFNSNATVERNVQSFAQFQSTGSSTATRIRHVGLPLDTELRAFTMRSKSTLNANPTVQRNVSASTAMTSVKISTGRYFWEEVTEAPEIWGTEPPRFNFWTPVGTNPELWKITGHHSSKSKAA